MIARASFAAVLPALLALGCGDEYVFRNPELAPAALQASPALLLPVGVRDLPGNGPDLAAAAAKAAAAAAGKSAIDVGASLPSLEAAGLADAAWEALDGMLHAADAHGLYDLSADARPCGKGLETLHGKMAKAAEIAARKFDLRFPPRYVIVLGIQGRGKGVLEGTLRFRATAALYDLQSMRTHTLALLDDVMADDQKALLGAMEDTPAELMGTLLAGAASAAD